MPKSFASGRYPLDWARMREMGLPPHGRTAIIERMLHAGVTIEDD